MTRKEELMGEYAKMPRRGNNMWHIFSNMLCGISHADMFLANSDWCKDHRAKKKIQENLEMAIKYLLAYKALLDDFPEFREYEMNSFNNGTASEYIRAKYLELRGKPLEKEKEE